MEIGPLIAETKILNLHAAASALRDEFIAWQCRLRKQAMREGGGRPTEGMCPRAFDPAGEVIAGSLKVLLARRDSEAMARLFEFQVKRTNDPLERYEKAVEALSADYYQHPANFNGVMAGLFGATSVLERLLESRQSVLAFRQSGRLYRVPCDVERLAPEDALFKLTYWHNAMFNPNLPADISVLAFDPAWARASRQPDADRES
jgi:hypothetical protein